MTDLLLVLNVAMFGLQSYYNPGIIMWGAKVTLLCAVVQAGGRRHSSLANLRIPKRRGSANLRIPINHEFAARIDICTSGPAPMDGVSIFAQTRCLNETVAQVVASMGAQINQKIAAGQLYRLISCTFLHGGLFHLLCNCKVPLSPLPSLPGPGFDAHSPNFPPRGEIEPNK